MLGLGREAAGTQLAGTALQQSPPPPFTSVPIHLQIREKDTTLDNCPPAFKEEVVTHTLACFPSCRKGSLRC